MSRCASGWFKVSGPLLLVLTPFHTHWWLENPLLLRGLQNCSLCPFSTRKCPRIHSTWGRKVPVSGLCLHPPNLGSLPFEHIPHLSPPPASFPSTPLLSVGISDSGLLPWLLFFWLYFLAQPRCDSTPRAGKPSPPMSSFHMTLRFCVFTYRAVLCPEPLTRAEDHILPKSPPHCDQGYFPRRSFFFLSLHR